MTNPTPNPPPPPAAAPPPGPDALRAVLDDLKRLRAKLRREATLMGKIARRIGGQSPRGDAIASSEKHYGLSSAYEVAASMVDGVLRAAKQRATQAEGN